MSCQGRAPAACTGDLADRQLGVREGRQFPGPPPNLVAVPLVMHRRHALDCLGRGPPPQRGNSPAFKTRATDSLILDISHLLDDKNRDSATMPGNCGRRSTLSHPGMSRRVGKVQQTLSYF
jgi:hypothetical protein